MAVGGIAEDFGGGDAVSPGAPGSVGAGEGVEGVFQVLELPGAELGPAIIEGSKHRWGGGYRGQVPFEKRRQSSLVIMDAFAAEGQRPLLVLQALVEFEVHDVGGVGVHLEGVATVREWAYRKGVEGEAACAEGFAKLRTSEEALPREEIHVRIVRGGFVPAESAGQLSFGCALHGADERRIDRDDDIAAKTDQIVGKRFHRPDRGVEAREADFVAQALENAKARFVAPRPGEVQANEESHARMVSCAGTQRFAAPNAAVSYPCSMAKPIPLPTSATGKSARAVIRECGKVAGQIMRDRFGHSTVTAVKGRGDVVTETDTAVEKAVMAILRQEFPTHAVLSEESAADVRSFGWMWVMDPVDGTKNFSRGLPHFAFNIALCHENEPEIALTVHPPLHEEFLALRGEGCFLNNRKITVSNVRTVRKSVVAIDLGYDDQRARRQLETALHLWPGMEALRVPGGPALGMAYLAAGRWDVYLHTSLKPWDVAAGLLLVAEAGGVITERSGGPATIFSDAILAAAPGVHADFLSLAEGLPWRA